MVHHERVCQFYQNVRDAYLQRGNTGLERGHLSSYNYFELKVNHVDLLSSYLKTDILEDEEDEDDIPALISQECVFCPNFF
jgi:hypothetical protein